MEDVQRWRPSHSCPGSFRRVTETFSRDDMDGYDPDDLLTTDDVARLYGVTIRRVQAMIASDTLRAIRYGRIWLVRAQDAYSRIDRRPGRPPRVLERDEFGYETWDDDWWDDD